MEYEIIINNINNDNWEALDINDTNTENIIYKLEQLIIIIKKSENKN